MAPLRCESTVAQIIEAQRVTHIAQLLSELNKMPPEKHETVRMPWSGSGEPLLDVIRIGVDEVLLNPQSHRIRAQLQDDPEWEELSKDPFGEAAQRLVERHVREARSAEQFAAFEGIACPRGSERSWGDDPQGSVDQR
jgi:hypothetical protein